MTSLQVLGLYYNQITDITPLSALTSLDQLWIHHNQITDITPLSALTSLWSLSLDNNQITDITPLTALTKLITLTLGDNPGKFSDYDETVVLLRSRVSPGYKRSRGRRACRMISIS
eukprot:SAG22_NODE_6575_length_836_cov_44.424695_2_plen_116_part_00